MKVNYITRHSIRNYGSVLQTFATQELLRIANATPKVVDYRQPGMDDTGWSYAANGRAQALGKPGMALYALARSYGVRRMGAHFESFLRTQVEMSSVTYRSLSALENSGEFSNEDVYCVGSDQVWNLAYNKDNKPYYLSFAPPGSTKFSLSSSLGMPSLPREEERVFRGALEDFRGVSVRESDAVEYLGTLGIDAHQHVDPVLALPREKWSEFADAQSGGREYILVYQLNSSRKFTQIISAVAKQLGLPVVRIEYSSNARSIGRPVNMLPSMPEFVGLFRDASFVVTDSFHGASFSMIFDRKFAVVRPPRYGSRLSSVLGLFGRQSSLVETESDAIRLVNDIDALPSTGDIFDRERDRVAAYIRSMLDQ